MRESHIRFIRQQGLSTREADMHLYRALMLQPRIVGAVTVLGVVLQSPWLFLALSAALWLSAFVPARNPFDAIYNYAIAYPRGLRRLGSAPPPRRFAAGMAGAVTLAIGVALLAGATTTAWVIEALLVVAVAQVVIGRFCSGAEMYHLLYRSGGSWRVLGGSGSGRFWGSGSGRF